MRKITILCFILVVFSCKKEEGKNYKTNYSVNDTIVGDFDRTKYPIIQEAIILKESNDLEAALEKFNDAENSYGKMIAILINRGVVNHQLGNIGDAISDFTECLEINEKYFPALLNRGLAYAYINEGKKSLIDLNMAIKIKPKEASAYVNRAVTFFAIDNFKSGCKDLEKAKILDVSGQYADGISKLEEEYCK